MAVDALLLLLLWVRLIRWNTTGEFRHKTSGCIIEHCTSGLPESILITCTDLLLSHHFKKQIKTKHCSNTCTIREYHETAVSSSVSFLLSLLPLSSHSTAFSASCGWFKAVTTPSLLSSHSWYLRKEHTSTVSRIYSWSLDGLGQQAIDRQNTGRRPILSNTQHHNMGDGLLVFLRVHTHYPCVLGCCFTQLTYLYIQYAWFNFARTTNFQCLHAEILNGFFTATIILNFWCAHNNCFHMMC